MKKSALIFGLLFLVGQACSAQVSYASNSGKVKAKVAKQEAKDAKNDEAYQALMQEGHDFFKNNDFDAAIDKYENAANRRPINVYPRVKIADVKLAMLSYVEEPEEKEPEPEVIEEPEVKKDPNLSDLDQNDRVNDAFDKENQKVRDSLPPPPKEIIEPKKDPVAIVQPHVEKEDIKIMTTDEFAESLAKDYADGVTEEQFEEGGKNITRRVVVKNGKGTDYRKVVHRWGGVFYFKNDKSITEHCWNTETVLED